MSCKKYKDNIFAYLDDALNQAERLDFEQHIETCSDCQRELQVETAIATQLADSPLQPLPASYSAELSAKLAQQKKPSNSRKVINFSKRYQKWLIAVVACLLLFVSAPVLLDNLGAGRPNDQAKLDEAPQYGNMVGGSAESGIESAEVFDGNNAEFKKAAPMTDAEKPAMDEQRDTSADLQARKLVKRGNISLTVTDYDQANQKIEVLLGSVNGYVENSNVSVFQHSVANRVIDYRQGDMILRVPSAQFEAVYRELLQLGKVDYQEQTSEDLTNIYRDTYNEVKNLEVRERALRKIMEKADQIKDIIAVENELSRVRGEINQLTGNLQKWDRLVDMATIHLNVVEKADDSQIVQPIDEGLLGRARRAFVISLNKLIKLLENAFVGFVGLLPIVIPVIVIVLITWAIVKYRRNKK